MKKKRSEKSKSLAFFNSDSLSSAIYKNPTLRKIKKQIRNYTKQWQSVFDNLPYPVFVTDKKYRIKFFNKACRKITRISGHRIENKFCWQVIYGDGKCKKHCPVVHVKKSKRRESVEAQIKNRFYWIRIDPFFDAHEKYAGAIFSFIDITERKQFESILNKSQERYRSLVKNINLGIYRSTPEGKFLEANPAMFTMFGFRSKKQFIRHSANDFYENLRDRRRFLRKIRKNGVVVAEELNLTKKNGKPIIISVYARAHYSKPNKVAWIDGVVEDITERKHIENKLAESENRFRRIVENSNDLIMLTSPDGVIDYLSPSSTKILGYTPQDLTGKIPKIFHKDDTEKIRKAISQAKRSKTGSNLEYRIITKRGKLKWVSHAWAPVEEKNKLQKVVSIISDITERKLTEIHEQEKINQMLRYQNALLQIAKMKSENFISAIQKTLEIDANTLNIERVSFWSVSEDISEIYCQDMYLRSKSKHEKGLILYAKNYPYYFKAIQEGRIIAVSDVYNDIKTFEFSNDYYKPNKISSMIDVPVWVHGKLVGIICHEHTGTLRRWSIEEQSFVTSVADTVSATFESYQRQIAQQLLKESEEKYRSLLQNLNVGVYRTNKDGRFLEVNSAFAKIFGYASPEAVKKQTVQDFYFDASQRPVIIEQLQKDGFIKNFEVLAKHEDGTPFHASMSVQCHYDKNGNIDWFDGVIEDVTERHKYENLLRRREAILEAITYASELFLASSDWKLTITEVLERLGKAAEVSRVYIFQKHLSAANRILVSQRYEWTAKNIIPQINNPQLQNFDALANDCHLINAIIEKGLPLIGITKEFPTGEQKIFSAQNILSIMVVPIYSGKSIWGFIGFDDCKEERQWSYVVTDALKIAANIIGAAILRQQIERELRENEYKYRTLVDISPFGIAVHDDNGKIIFVNPSAMQMLGATSPDQLIGQSVIKFIHPDYQQAIKPRIQKLFKTQKVLHVIEEKYVRLDGTVIDVEVYGKSFIYNNKPAIMVIANDITERNRINTLIKESEEKYRSLVKNINVGIYRSTPAGKFIEVNPAFVRMFGYQSIPEIMEKPVIDLYVNPADRKIYLNKMKKYGNVKNFVTEQKKKNGSKIFVSLTAQAHYDGKGKIDWYDGIVEDITERKQAELLLKQSEECYRALFETANDGICIMSPEGRIISANKRLLDMAGMKKVQYGHHISEYNVFSPESLVLIEKNLKARLAGAEIEPYELVLHPKKGEIKNVEITANMLRDAENKVIGEVVFIRDITRQKKAERTILQAKESAETANKAKTAFLHNMSHELRSPMTSILGFTNLLLDSAQSSENKEQLEIIKNSSNYLLKLINDLLDLSRIEAGKITVENKETNIIDSFNKIYQRYRAVAKNKNIKLNLIIDKNLPQYIIADRTKIEQIINNLLDNSFKFTEKGTVEIYAGLKYDNQTKSSFLSFYIKDTGIGIKSDQIKRIFEKFEQSELYITKKYSGAGLGLTIIKQLVDLLKGTVSVTSQLSKGTKFTIQIPVDIIKKNKIASHK